MCIPVRMLLQRLTLKEVTWEFSSLDSKPGILYLRQPPPFYMRRDLGRSLAHQCPCGCGNVSLIPVLEGEAVKGEYWGISKDGRMVTVTPSIHNTGFPCQSHYHIQGNKIVWAEEPEPFRTYKS